MKSVMDKRKILCDLAEVYLDTKENSYISIVDGIMDSHDLDTIAFLMLLALTYSKEEVKSIYSIDFCFSEEESKNFIEKEYNRVMKQKKDQPSLGKIILIDAKDYYQSKFYQDKEENIEEVGRHFSI